MPEIIQGYNTEQTTSQVANNSTAINAEIALKDADGWLLSGSVVSGSDIILFFTRNVPIVAP